MFAAKGIAWTAVFLISNLALAGEYHYHIKSISPNKLDHECHEKLTQTSELFRRFADVEVTSIGCEVSTIDDRTLDGVITYRSSSRIPITKLVQSGHFGVEETALYATEEACLNALSNQEALFTSQTGLRPHITYCYGNFSTLYGRWTLQIEAAGHSEIKHFVMGVDLFGVPYRGYDAYWQEISDKLAAKGLVVSKSALVKKGFYRRATIGYYGRERKQIYHNGEVRFITRAACTEAENRIARAFEQLDNQPLAIFCDQGQSGLWGHRLNIYSLERSNQESSEFAHRVLPGFYRSVDHCSNSRARQIEILEAQGNKVLDVVCGEDSQQRIILHVFFLK